MNCETFESVASDLAREQIIEANLREEALAHCRRCESCAVMLQDQQALTLGLRALADQMRFVEASPVVEASLLASLDERPQQTAVGRITHPWRYRGVAAAAAFLLILGIAATRALFTTPSGPQPQNDQGVLIPNPPQPPPTTPPSHTEITVENPKLASRPDRNGFRRTSRNLVAASRRRGSIAQQSVASNGASTGHEIATEFLPLPYRNTLNFQDGGRIVRVELPRSAMASFGFPVNIDRANERVKADVLFGVDGLAQAIRFIQ